MQQVDGELQPVRPQGLAHGLAHPHRSPHLADGAQLHPQGQEQSHGQVDWQHRATEAQNLQRQKSKPPVDVCTYTHLSNLKDRVYM